MLKSDVCHPPPSAEGAEGGGSMWIHGSTNCGCVFIPAAESFCVGLSNIMWRGGFRPFETPRIINSQLCPDLCCCIMRNVSAAENWEYCRSNLDDVKFIDRNLGQFKKPNSTMYYASCNLFLTTAWKHKMRMRSEHFLKIAIGPFTGAWHLGTAGQATCGNCS